MTDDNDRRPCPYCGTDPGAEEAAACAHCGMRRVEVLSAEIVRGRLAAKELALRAKLVGELYEDLPRRDRGVLRGRTKLLLALLLVCIAGGVASYVIGEVPRPYWKVIAMLGAIVFLVFRTFLAQDMKVPSPSGRKSPRAGLRAFLYALITGNYRYAHGCLVPGERDELTRRQPEIEDLGALGRHYEFNRLDGFRRYWRALVEPVRKLALHFSHARILDLNIEKTEGDFALVSCDLYVNLWDWRITEEDYPIMRLFRYAPPLFWVPWVVNLCMPQRRRLHLRKLMRRIDGQWYLVNGEAFSREDFALEEAARIAGLSEVELKTELEASS